MTKSDAYLSFAFPGVPAVRCLFSTCQAGNMSGPTFSRGITENRQRLMEYAGFAEWAEVHQVHGDELVEAVQSSHAEQPSVQADGLYTAVKGRALVIKTADCQSILFARQDGSAVCAIHAGWRGNRLKFPATAVKKFCAWCSCSPEEVVAVRGPSLGMAEFVNFEAEWPPEFNPWFDAKKQTMDLWGLTRFQLTEAGVLPQHIYGLDYCTLSLSGMFFSHRRNELERQVSVIWIAD